MTNKSNLNINIIVIYTDSWLIIHTIAIQQKTTLEFTKYVKDALEVSITTNRD
jgi:hypothetical protein